MSTVSCSTTTTTAYKVTADTTGTLVLQTGASPTTAVTIDASQVVTFANQPTFTGGTANGVMYLNGSKAVTTGSALTFDGTNLGLGVTPSAWSVFKAFDINTVGSVAASTTSMSLFRNAYYNGSNFLYKTTDTAERYYLGGGQHQWFTATSGTAGNAISFTQAMTLDANGWLGVGATAPLNSNYKFSVVGNRTNLAANSSALNLYLQYNSATSGFFLGSPSADALAMTDSNGNERARIDSDGNFLVGRTSTTRNGLDVYYANKDCINASTGQAAGTSRSFYTGWYSATASTTGTLAFNVTSNGNVYNTNGSYGTISDIKLKENIVDASPKLADMMQVRVVNYNLKEGQTHKQIGVIAQELEQVFPGMVEETPDRDAEGNDLGTTTKAVKYSVFVPMLIKALQEQQALITQLQADVAALKGAA